MGMSAAWKWLGRFMFRPQWGFLSLLAAFVMGDVLSHVSWWVGTPVLIAVFTVTVGLEAQWGRRHVGDQAVVAVREFAREYRRVAGR
jgi:hypothetical protein